MDPLEQALHTHGDELYQTALLLTLEPHGAEALLLRAVRSLATHPPAAPGMVTLTAALLAAMPAKRRQPAKLNWGPAGTDSMLLAQIAKLSIEQRLALDLLLRRDYEPQQVAPLFDHDAARAENELYTALLALAPHVEPDLSPTLLIGMDASEECRQTRRLLAVAPGAVFDRTVRAHLATCSGCRAAEQAWNRVRAAVEQAMRTALRGVELPATAHERIAAALAPQRSVPFAGRISPRMLRWAVPVVVLLFVAVLVLPRPRQATTTGSSGSATVAEPRALVQQAIDTLYTPEPGQETWHAQYHMRWNFSERMYVNLVGDIWRASAPDRFRAQLVHSEGGAPYEFLLNSGEQYMYYANTSLYGRSLFGPLADQYPREVGMRIPREQRIQVEQARLDSGAWGLPAQYLRQALNTERLSTWGKQRGADGRYHIVIGFNGYSPLQIASDVPNVAQNPTTILLTVDAENGRLREIREVTGPAGGEQVGRTVWRQVSESEINPETLATTFTVEQAYNGTGRFAFRLDENGAADGVADPYLPMVPASAIRPPTDGIGNLQLPVSVPPGIDRVLVISPNPWEQITTVYLGAGRMMTVNERDSAIDDSPTRDLLESQYELTWREPYRMLLVPNVASSFNLQLERVGNEQSTRQTTQINAFGFTRAEMLQIADSIQPFSLLNYTTNAQLFRSLQPHDPQALAALLGAVQPQPLAEGEARYVVEETFQRQGPLEDPFPDPYHTPYYPQGSDTLTLEQWVRRVNDRLEFWTQRRNAAGETINQSLESAAGNYWYDRVNNYSFKYTPSAPPTDEPVIEPMWSVINILGCGGTTLETQPNGTRIVTQVDQDWYKASCNRSTYSSLAFAQIGGSAQTKYPFPQTYNNQYYGDTAVDSGPYLADLLDMPERTLYNRIFINRDGQAFRYEVRAGAPNGMLLESVEIKQERRVPAAEAPAGVFANESPKALFMGTDAQADPAQVNNFVRTREVTFTQVITQLQIPLWYLPPADDVELRSVFAADARNPIATWSNDVFNTALHSGIAAQLVYGPPPNDTNRQSQTIYVGRAEAFGALLRTQRAWRESSPMQIEIGGQPTEAWQVTTQDSKQWCLFERGGALIAVEIGTPQRIDRIARLQPFQP